MAAIAFCIAFRSAHAQDLTNTWSGTGGAWTTANQPDFVSSTGGTLYSDQSIAVAANNSTSNTDAILTVGAGKYEGIYAPSSNPPGYLYVGSGTPAITLSTSYILDDVKSITLSIDVAYGTFEANSMSLTVNGGSVDSNPTFTTVDTGATAQGLEVYDYIYNWDVSDLGSISDLSVSWDTPVAHTAYTDVGLTQSVEAIPEPSTWMLLSGGLCLILWASKLRKASRAGKSRRELSSRWDAARDCIRM